MRKKRCIASLLISISFIIVVITFNSEQLNFVAKYGCTDYSVKSALAQLCDEVKNGIHANSDLCQSLCEEELRNDVSCLGFHFQKDFVFESGNLIFKSFDSDLEIDELLLEQPEKFVRSVKRYLMRKFNMKADDKIVQKLRFLSDSVDPFEFNGEGDSIDFWHSIHSSEFVWATLLAGKNVVAESAGICGNFYAVRKLQTFSAGNLKAKSGNLELALNFLSLMERLEGEGLTFCDIKMDNFGWDERSRSLAVIDADHIELGVKVTSGWCQTDADCEGSLRCHFKCDRVRNRCEMVTSNLQLICRDLFLFWQRDRAPDRPGLLTSIPVSGSLMDVVRKCSRFEEPNNKTAVVRLKDTLKRSLLDELALLQTNIAATSGPALSGLNNRWYSYPAVF